MGLLVAAALVRAARGHGIIVSSGARAAFELRGPYDVMNLVTLCGLTEQQAKVHSEYTSEVSVPPNRLHSCMILYTSHSSVPCRSCVPPDQVFACRS